MGIIETGVEGVKLLVPPKTNDLDEQQRWRWVVFTAIIALAASLTLHIALACGWMPAVFPGFASTTDAQNIRKDNQGLQDKLNILVQIGLEREMRAKMTELCKEREERKRIELNEDIARLQREYRNITRYWYEVPRCDQL